MPDYNLSGLSARSFEKLVQAFASKVLGTGIVVFGDGPDGGREATYEGRLAFPTPAAPWDGYCVLQAKFLQRPKAPQADGNWLLQQLREELEVYASPKSGRRPPDYYILATNVVLTPVQDTGSKDKIERLFRRYRKQTKMRDWRVWDFDQIGTFLDGYEDIRHAYAAWITSGDVLAKALQVLRGTAPSFSTVIANFLAKELRADQFAKLEQAGHSADQRIPLASVFVDLPISDKRHLEPPPEAVERIEGQRTFAREILAVAREKLSPSSLSALPDRDRADPRSLGRYVLIGGPGQGKSTLGQFICQLFRASLLQNQPSHLLAVEVKEALAAIRAQCESDDLEVTCARRFPMRIVLSEFADACKRAQTDRPLSLIAYMAQIIHSRAGHDVSADDLRRWLAAYPWLIVLDGLDEVPASANRDEILTKIEDFWTDCAQLDADVLVIAATRPQGYSDDFSPRHYRHVWLVPLSRSRAMHYAKRLAGVKHGHDSERSAKVIARLEQAVRHESTGRLMRSPLQITIMATLVDQIGQAPQDRWRLFHEYYQVIYRREMEKDIPAAELLRSHRKDIDIIHYRAALLLQVESERSGGVEARLDIRRFGALVSARLAEEEVPEPERGRLTQQIIRAVAERLVFLVAPQAEQVGFEIRSLQEFMAAEAMMQGPDTEIQARLRAIAPITSWRNVFLFAAGRCFGEAQHLRDTIYAICSELNAGASGQFAQIVRTGSMLALDLFDDGVVHKQPRYGKLLMGCALRVLDMPPSELQGRLADGYQPELEQVIREELEGRLASSRTREQLAAWAALLALVGRGVGWARRMADDAWGRTDLPGGAILELGTAMRAGAWAFPKLNEEIPRRPPHRVPAMTYAYGAGPRRTEVMRKSYPWLALWLRVYEHPRFGGQHIPFRLSASQAGSVMLRLVRLADVPVAELPEVDSEEAILDWAPITEGINFARSPSRAALAVGLRRVAERAGPSSYSRWFLGDAVPWVFGACLDACRDREELQTLSSLAERGDLGDTEDWLAAEARWQRAGVTTDDLATATDQWWPFRANIRESGFPFATTWAGWLPEPSAETSSALFALYERLSTQTRLRAQVASWVLLALRQETDEAPRPSIPAWVTPETVTRLDADGASRIYWDMFSLAAALLRAGKLDRSWVGFLEEIGQEEGRLEPWHRRADYADLAERLAEVVEQEPNRVGLLRLWSRLLISGTRPKRSRRIGRDRDSSPSIHQARIVAEIATVGVSPDRARLLADETVALGKSSEAAFSEILQTLSTQEAFGAGTDDYLLALYSMVDRDHSGLIAPLVACINDALRRKRSHIERFESWRALGLPESLLPLFSQPQ